MPNYLYMSKFILIVLVYSLSIAYRSCGQGRPKKYGTNPQAISKIADRKVAEFSKDVNINPVQKKKIRAYFYKEAQMIDSLKFLPPDFFTYPEEARERIINIKRHTEEKIRNVLSEEQQILLDRRREDKRLKAIQKLNEETLRKTAKR